MRIEATQNSFGNVPLVSISWNDLRSIGANTFLKVIKNSVPNSKESGLFGLEHFLIITLIEQGAMDLFSLFI